MNSLAIRVLTALITFTIGVWIAGPWVARHVSRPTPVTIASPARTVEMVFVLDTTGSMGGLIEGAKQRIWGIVNEVMREPHSPSVRIGLVAYRDRGDQYVTKVLPLTEDLDKVYTTLMDYHAAGGGDAPEDVRTALAEGVYKAGWSDAAPDVAQVIFLVGDAPPHDDYQHAPDTLVTAANAVKKGMVVNTIQCGHLEGTKEIWQAIARRGQGQYFSIAQHGGVQSISTPFDEQLGQLATELGGTAVAYGYGEGPEGERLRAEAMRNLAAAETRVTLIAPAQAKAERAVNKAISSMAYVGDLLQEIETGSTKLEAVKTQDLPYYLKTLSPEERKQEIEKRLAHRREVRGKILDLSNQREAFIKAERKKVGGKEDGFDGVVVKALKEQIGRKRTK